VTPWWLALIALFAGAAAGFLIAAALVASARKAEKNELARLRDIVCRSNLAVEVDCNG
jgi:uncharacterized membrane-anchored protein YhcB (DUF1043 family)